MYPRLIGRDIHVHPLVDITAAVAVAELDGVTGIFIAVPAVAVASVAARPGSDGRSEKAGNQDDGLE